MKTLKLFGLAVVSRVWLFTLCAVLLPLSATAIQITAGPVARTIGFGHAGVTWTTDVPGDTRLDYGPDWNFGMTQYFPNPTTSHSVQVNVQPNAVFYYRVSSSDEPGSAYDMGWCIVPDPLAEILIPGDDDLVVTGASIRIVAVLRDVRISCQSVDFRVAYVPTGQQTPIGTDTDGTQWMLNTYGPVIDGDGWSGYWNTNGFAEGEYDLLASMQTDIGVIQAQRRVYYDRTPPVPTITSPARIIDIVSGSVAITATGASDADHCDIFFKPGEDPVRFATVPLKQTDYPFDGNDGRSMCDPTAEASIIWSGADEDTRNEIRNLPPAPGHACPEDDDEDDCAIRRLIEMLAREKGTNGVIGTGDLNTKAGTDRVMTRLKVNWKFRPLNPCNREELKKKSQKIDGQPGARVIGVGVDIKYPSGKGHALALKEMKDIPGTDGKYDVTFMDPATGGDCKVKMDQDASFEYPPEPPGSGQRVTIKGGGIWYKPPGGGGMSPHAPTPEWVLIGTDTSPADGISVSWDTTGVAPGIYWILAEATDTLGHTGRDAVEVGIPTSIPKLSDAKSQPDSMPVVVTGKVVTGVIGSSFWIEDDNRTSGIRVSRTGETIKAGYRVSVKGFMSTNGPEREINARGVYDILTGATIPGPLAMNNKSLGGSSIGSPPLGQYGVTDGLGLNNVGLLITTWGCVSCVDSLYMIISDGSNSGIKVSTAQLTAPLPDIDDYISVTGISSLFMSGIDRAPLVLPRDNDDVK